MNVVKVTAPFVEEVGEIAFDGACNLRHVTPGPNVVVKPGVFFFHFSLEVLAASVGIKVDTGDKYLGGNDPTVGTTRFWKCQNQEDARSREYYQTVMVMLELCDRQRSSGSMRPWTYDPLWPFVVGPGRDVAKLIMCFRVGEGEGRGGLREASKTKLLEVGFELKVLGMGNNGGNMKH
jgi:hypothetical protein